MSDLLLMPAYIDPASGSIIFQVIVAAMLTVGVIFRHYLFAPVAFVKRMFSRGQKADTPS